MKKNLCLLFTLTITLFFINSNIAFSQSTQIIKGKVLDDDGNPMIGASVILKGTERGTVTDLDGAFQIEADSGKIELIINYTGFESKSVLLNSKPGVTEDLVINIDQAVAELSEVVVTGYVVRKEKKALGYGKTIISGKRKDSHYYVDGISVKKRGKKRPRKKGDSKIGMTKPESTASAVVDAEYEDNSVSAGLLTAGEIHDFSKWELWEDIAKEDLSRFKTLWKMEPLERYAVQAITESGHPIVDAEVKLRGKKNTLIWTARTDNTGKAELWANLFLDEKNVNATSLTLEYNNETHQLDAITKFQEGINIFKIAQDCDIPQTVDLLFAVDATSSMGDELEYLKAELKDIIAKAKDKHQALDFNLGAVFYRDKGDQYITRKSDFSSKINQTIDFIKNQSAAGGGDAPEAVDSALQVALHEQNWSKNAVARLLFLILDAPPHNNPEVIQKLNDLAQVAAEKGIRIIPVTASGIDKSGEYLMRSLALATNGTYTFLTDHSGIGNSHIEPSTDEYKVETLNELLLRLLDQFTQTTQCDEVPAFAENINESNKNVDNENENNSAGEPNQNEQNEAPFKIKYYPNPTTGLLNLELEKSLKTLFVTDLSGKILQRHQSLQKGKMQIDLGNFPSGIYFLKYEFKRKPYSEKVMVIR